VPNETIKLSVDFASISTNETYIITPALNPKLAAKNFLLKAILLKTNIPPIPVDKPANNVNRNAKV
jgi:hypothetical protein